MRADEGMTRAAFAAFRLMAAAALVAVLPACTGDGGIDPVPPDPGYRTSQPAMAVGLGGAAVQPILSVGDTVPGGLVWAPLPDGLGGYAEGGQVVLFSNHEIGSGGVLGTDGSAKFAYARVSRLVLDRASVTVLGGSLAVDPSAGYRSLCSATFVDAVVGFPGGWFLAGEEVFGSGKDGMQLAVSKTGQVVEMPWMGRFAHENTVAIPGFSGGRVVLAGLDDSRGRSELYLYVAASEGAVIGGQGTLYVLASAQAANVGQLAVGQAIDARFVAVPNAASLSSAQLQAAVDALGALKFVGVEDGDYDRRGGTPALYFVDTGSATVPSAAAPWDPYGSIYRLELQAADPTQARLILLARSQGPATGWASPDNVGTSAKSLMVQEDPSHADWARAPQILRFPLAAGGGLGAPQPVAQLTNPECRYTSGTCWESSGIVDASAWFGEGAWLFDIQAHGRPEPRLGLASESGQLLMLRAPGS
ncbi:MAG TPA: alkaline phosphatase PhoX [Longimicrobium sp.]|nr:alkaline phosphatase PhoX [Longimicrobium sp.]